MASKKRIVISEDFSRFPAGRFYSDGPFPGQKFRERHLVPALKKYDIVEVDLDNVLGFGSSFLEESFGGLVRVEHFEARTLHEQLRLICTEDETAIEDIWHYIDDAQVGEIDDVSQR